MSDAFETAVKTVRFLSVDGVEAANSGHPGTPMALAGIAVELFTQRLRYNPDDPHWLGRDRFVLSCGHASMLIYSMLHLAGYDLPLEELKNFRQWGSKTPGHPEYGHTAGVETTTGPLGQGVGNAVGLALAGKMMEARVGADVVGYRVYGLCSDGDLMEGVASEAASLGGHLGLNNLIMIYDDNKITIDGSTELSFSEDVGKRFEAYGWAVQRVDGHDRTAVAAALDVAEAEANRPSLIVARTHIGIGAPTKQDTSKAHGAPLGAAEVEATKKAAGWPLEPKFHVPDEVRALFASRKAENLEVYRSWHSRLAARPADRRALLDRYSTRAIPEDLFAQLLASCAPAKEATRTISAKVEQKLAELVPSFVGGAADLAESTKTHIKGSADVKRGEYAGRNLNFGIREHGMGAIVNGLALSGFFIPFGSTFLIFSDYMRPPIRLAALMKVQVVHVFTHDSIFLGEDGPTHQPIEMLWALRAIPNCDVVRPADAAECAAAWTHALTRRDGPTVFALCRQNLPPIERPAGFDNARLLDGAYVVSDVEGAQLTLIATGSETHVAVAAAQQLASEGVKARVVSAPCWDAFERLPKDRQRAVLGAAPLVTIEAGCTLGWRAAVGSTGLCIGIDHYGASAPAERLATEFGFSADKVVAAIHAWRGS